MMNCQRARELMIGCAGTAPLPPGLEEHLATCADCEAMFALQRDARDALRSLPWPNPSPSLEARLRAVGQSAPAAGRVGAPEAGGPASHVGHSASGSGPGSVRRWLAGSLHQGLGQPAPPPLRGASWHWPELALLAGAAVLAAILFAGPRTAAPTRPQPASAATSTPAPTAAPTSGYPTLAALPTFAPTVVPSALWAPIDQVVYTYGGGSPPEYGRRPYHTTVSASDAWTIMIEHPQRCRLAWLDFGDGAIEAMPCPESPADSYPNSPDSPEWTGGAYPYWPGSAPYSASHTYERAGIYHPQLKVAVDDGTLIVQPTTDVLVFDTAAESGGLGLVTRLLVFMALAAVAAGALWQRSPARLRRIGFFVVTLLLVFLAILALADQTANRTALLRPYLESLVGQTGLDPLDPRAPLASYRFSWPGVEFTYSDGTKRNYQIPMEYGPPFGGGRLRDGLGRLRTEHRELPGLPFAKQGDGVRLGIPRRLALHRDAESLGADRRNWLEANCGLSSVLRPAPDNSAFLMAVSAGPSGNTLWLVPFDGEPPLQLARSVQDFVWSPDGRYVVLTYPATGDPRGEMAVNAINVRKSARREIKRLPSGSRVGVTADGVWYVTDGPAEVRGAEVWLAPFDGGPAQRLMTQLGAAFVPSNVVNHHVARWPAAVAGGPIVRPSPDGQWLAYSCRGGTCLLDVANDDGSVVAITAEEIAWSPDSARLATVGTTGQAGPSGYAETGNGRLVLTLVPRDGLARRQVRLMPTDREWTGKVLPPQWTPDGKRLFLTTCPYDGRRILTVDADSGAVLDLSQPRWDAWAALMPSGDQLLLSTGRGGYWTVDVAVP